MKPPALFGALLAGLLLIASPALAQSITVKGPTGQVQTFTAADIAALPRVKLSFSAHGETHEYEGPLLIDLLAKAGAPTDKALRGPVLAQVVLVTASDGYKVALGLAEADPGTRPNRIILADKADGKPLDDKTGPFKLVVEGDLRPARGAKMVTSIEVIDLGKAP